MGPVSSSNCSARSSRAGVGSSREQEKGYQAYSSRHSAWRDESCGSGVSVDELEQEFAHLNLT